MKNILLLLLIIIIVGFVCCRNNIKDSAKSINTAIRSDSELARLIFQEGDSSAYYELSMQYLDYGYERFLPFALIMANKYDYQQAYFDIFDCLWHIYGKPTAELILLEDLDSTTQKMAIDYLIKASFKGHEQAKEILGEYYLRGLYVDKDTLLGKRLIQEARNSRD